MAEKTQYPEDVLASMPKLFLSQSLDFLEG
jgi:hypothetical protein